MNNFNFDYFAKKFTEQWPQREFRFWLHTGQQEFRVDILPNGLCLANDERRTPAREIPALKWGVQVLSTDRKFISGTLWTAPEIIEQMVNPVWLIDDMFKRMERSLEKHLSAAKLDT